MIKEFSEQVILAIVGGVITVFATVFGAFLWWLIRSIINNTKELAVLNSKIEIIFANSEAIPKMKQDLNALHEWKRNFEGAHK